MSIILALDSASGSCSAAISKNGEIISLQIDETKFKQAERLIGLVENALAEAGISYNDIDIIASAIGPGSFTGLRVAMAAAKGFHIALNKPVIGVSNLYAMALQKDNIPENETFICAINAGREQLYTQQFDINNTVITAQAEPRIIAADDLPTDITIVKDKAVNALHIARAANAMISENNFVETGYPQFAPLYIREPDAKR